MFAIFVRGVSIRIFRFLKRNVDILGVVYVVRLRQRLEYEAVHRVIFRT